MALLLVGLGACDGARHYETRGVVTDVRPDWNQVVIAHEDIPGLMPAMTMNFDVLDAALFEVLEKGKAISFTIAFDGRSYRVVEASVLGDGDPGRSPGLAALLPERDPAPDFSLVDQGGQPVSLASLRGTVLLVDFIYTSCPGPCPILTARHVEVQRALSPELRGRTRFVSISIDPAVDTPAALRAYAEARGADLEHWSFLTGPVDAVAGVVRAFGVGTLRKPDGEIDHRVAAFLVDGEGKIAERYIGLDHDSDTLIRDLQRVASG